MTNDQMIATINELKSQLERVSGRAAVLQDMVQIMIDNEVSRPIKATYTARLDELLETNPEDAPDFFKGIHEVASRLR